MDIKIKNISMEELLTLARLIGKKNEEEVVENGETDKPLKLSTLRLANHKLVNPTNFTGKRSITNLSASKYCRINVSDDKPTDLSLKGYPVTVYANIPVIKAYFNDNSLIHLEGKLINPGDFDLLDEVNIDTVDIVLYPFIHNTEYAGPIVKMYCSEMHITTVKEIVDEPANKAKDYNLSSVEAGKILGCSKGTVGWYARNKNLPHEKVGSRLYFNEEEILEWNKSIGKECRRGSYSKKPKRPVSEYSAWRADKSKEIRAAGLDEGKTLSLVFKRMTKDYGVSWDQVKKDFFKANGYPSRSTLQACYWYCNNTDDPDVTVRLFDGCLGSYIQELKKEKQNV